MKGWAVLVQYSLVSTFIWQYQHHAGFIMVVGQDSLLSGGDFCRMAIRIYETVQQCVRVQPPSSVGYFYPDGQCRSIVRDTPLNASIVYLEQPGDPANVSVDTLFPGNYRAECTSDGESIRFIESGCRSDQCSPLTNGTCESGDSEIALAYSGQEVFAKYPIGGNWACPSIYTEAANFSFIIQGDCSKPGCMVNGVLNPLSTTKAPVAAAPSSTTDSPTISKTGSPTGVTVTTITGNESGGDFCRMAIRIYETIEQCVRVQPHSSIGYFYPDGQCRSIVRDTPLNASIVYLEQPGDPANVLVDMLFPGNYRAECTSDGESIRFIESGCRSDQCSLLTNGTCESGDSEIALAYSGQEVFAKYPIGGNWACPSIYTEAANFSFIIQGDCSKPGCMVNGVLNPLSTTEAPVAAALSSTTDSPTISKTGSPTGVPVTTTTGTIISSSGSIPIVAIVIGVVGTILGLAGFLLIYKLALAYWMQQPNRTNNTARHPGHGPDTASSAPTLPSSSATPVEVLQVLQSSSVLQDQPFFKNQTDNELPHADPVPQY